MSRPLPRFVRIKTLASGVIAFYWDLTGYYRGLGCSIPGEPLGTDYVSGVRRGRQWWARGRAQCAVRRMETCPIRRACSKAS